MYFGLSFSRVGADFRALMAPIFINYIRQNISSSLSDVSDSFVRELEKYTLINKVALHSRQLNESVSATDLNIDSNLTPPETLLDFHPLAALCNGYLNVLNCLRLCAPLAVADHLTQCLQQALELVARNILTFYRQEQQAFTASERETFTKLCSCFAYDLLPYVQHCIHAIFPQQTLMAQMGVNLLSLEKSKITHLQKDIILEPLKHLLPQKIESMGARTPMPSADESVKNLEAATAIATEG